MSPSIAFIAVLIISCVVVVNAYASPGGALAIAIAPPAIFLAITATALTIVVTGDAGSLPKHVSTLAGTDCGVREFARTETAPLAPLAGGGDDAKFCLTCRVWRPPRARHCSTCGHCVAGYDHHCGALGRCVGEGNAQAFAILIVASTLAAGGVITQTLTALSTGVDNCPAPSLPLLLKTMPGIFGCGIALASLGGIIYALTCVVCARSRIARFGKLLLFLGVFFLGGAFFSFYRPCLALLPALLTLLITLPLMINLGAISVNHAVGLAVRAKIVKIVVGATRLLDEEGERGGGACIATPNITAVDVLVAIAAALVSRPPPPRVDFHADATALARAIDAAKKALFDAAAVGKPLECGAVAWRGGEAVRMAILASLQQSALMVDVETYAIHAAAGLVPLGVLAGNNTWPSGSGPSGLELESVSHPFL